MMLAAAEDNELLLNLNDISFWSLSRVDLSIINGDGAEKPSFWLEKSPCGEF